MSETKQACKHKIDWDDYEIVELTSKYVEFSIGCIECYTEWRLRYDLVSVESQEETSGIWNEDLDLELFPEDKTVKVSE